MNFVKADYKYLSEGGLQSETGRSDEDAEAEPVPEKSMKPRAGDSDQGVINFRAVFLKTTFVNHQQ